MTCAGSLDRDRATVEGLRAQLRAEGLADRVALIGDLEADALAIEYDRADLFVLATWYEGYGMAVAEALARGVPVVSTATGAIERLVAGLPGHEAGLVVPPGNLEAFTQALERAIGDPALRSRLAEGARHVRERLPTWDDAIAEMDHVLSGGHSATVVPNSGTDSGTVLRHRTPAPYSGTVLRHQTPAPGFTADWLALREPADRAARSMRLTRAIADAMPRDREVRVLDLGAGTGANLRYLARHLPRQQDWLLVDHDPALLARVSAPDARDDRVQTRELDLRRLGADERDLFAGRSLVTASALLDLVSADWVHALAARCQESGAAVLFALSYDGRIHCSPEEPEDMEIRDLVNLHQQTDKGFGCALGPDASRTTADCFLGLGYRVERERSDWILDTDAQALQHQLIDGWAQAAAEIAPTRAVSIATWRDRRLAHVAAGRSQIIVGHEDLAAIPQPKASNSTCDRD